MTFQEWMKTYKLGLELAGIERAFMDCYNAGANAAMEKFAQGVKISIPTDAMEQEFSAYYSRGYVRGSDAEREACALLVDHILKPGGGTYGDAIRARGESQ